MPETEQTKAMKIAQDKWDGAIKAVARVRKVFREIEETLQLAEKELQKAEANYKNLLYRYSGMMDDHEDSE